MAASTHILSQFANSALEALPEGLQRILQSPRTSKGLCAVLAYAVLRTSNSALNSLVANNWTSDQFRHSQELVLITGGSSGIGREAALDLSSRGIKVVVLDINRPSSEFPNNVHFYECDITSSASLASVAETVRAKHGHPTVLVNNAGVAFDGTILEEPEQNIRRTFEVNTISHFLTVKEFLPAMVKANHGHVITMASLASFVSGGELGDYSCSKTSALAFHECLSQELKHYYKASKVRTSIIHPIWVRTPMIQFLIDSGRLTRYLEPQDVSRAIVKQILDQKSGQLILPPKLLIYSLLRAMPGWLQASIRGIMGRAAAKGRTSQKAQAP